MRRAAASAAVILAAQARRELGRERRRQIGHLFGLAGLAVCVAAVPGLIFLNSFLAARAERRSWDISGPVCPAVAKPSVVATSRRRPPMTHQYGDAHFTRAFGAVSCAGFRHPSFGPERVYHVCQFNNPGAVTVKTARETRTFEAEPGKALTIRVEAGTVGCVVGGWFRLK